MRAYPNGGKAFATCVYDAITGRGVKPTPLFTPTLPLPQVMSSSSRTSTRSSSASSASTTRTTTTHATAPSLPPKGSWDGAYPVNGTVKCTNLSDGTTKLETTNDIFTVKNNVVTSGNLSAPIDAQGNAVLSTGTITAKIHFTRSNDTVFASAQATGRLSVTSSSGQPVPVSCTTDVSGGWSPLSATTSAAAPVSTQQTPAPQQIRQPQLPSVPSSPQTSSQTSSIPALRSPSTGGTWDGAYGLHGTIKCTSDDGQTLKQDFNEGGTVVNNVLPTAAGSTRIDGNGNVSFTLPITQGVSVTYSLHFTRSGRSLGVSGSINGGGQVNHADGTVTNWKCSAPVNGSADAPEEECPEDTPTAPAPQSSPPSSPSTPSVPRTCVQPEYNCWQKCGNLPSYPTYQKEACLTQCGNEYQAAQDAYNQCIGY
ncbi:MAG: hypothetical protein V1926_06185 [Candidatus Peregrinibacteria bacterium]